MGLIKHLATFFTGAGNRQEGIQDGSPSVGTESAVPVTMDTAMQLSAVWACTKLMAESVGSLPVNVYKIDRKTGVRVKDPDHYLSKLFDRKVNRWQTRQEFFETLVYQYVLLGNSYSRIQRNGAGEITSLIPLMSQQMDVTLLSGGAVVYEYSDGKNVNVYSSNSIWHNKQFGNGIIGLSTLEYARTSLGIASAAEKTTTKIYNNGGKPSGVLTIDEVISAEQRKQVKANFSEMSEGNSNRLFVLEAGMKYQQISLSPQDIELLASRRFQIEDICRFFGVPSVLVNDSTASTTWGSGVEQIVQGFYKLNLRPLLERLESSMKASLLSVEDQLDYDIEFDFNALLRPDIAERIKTGKEGVQGGLITPNEFRETEGMQPKEGGDELFMQQQMLPLKSGLREGNRNGSN